MERKKTISEQEKTLLRGTVTKRKSPLQKSKKKGRREKGKEEEEKEEEEKEENQRKLSPPSPPPSIQCTYCHKALKSLLT